MRLKELMRVLIAEEMTDVSVYNVDAGLFGSNEKIGDKIRELFTRIAQGKKTRLKALSKISKEGVGFRQRKTEGSRSIEASLRTHADRSEKTVVLYRSLLKLINKPEYKEILKDIISRERGHLAAIKELQTEIVDL